MGSSDAALSDEAWGIAPLSAPLIFVSQMANLLSLGFQRVQEEFGGFIGHSQGLASALVASSSRSVADVYHFSRYSTLNLV